jgi:hypothetical protein
MFASVVFAIGGLFGLGQMISWYQLDGSPTYYALLGTVGAWQILFLLIAWKPSELRPAMIPAVLEKLLWCVTLFVMYSRGSLSSTDLAVGATPNGLLGVLFALAYFRTSRRVPAAAPPNG